ncbi:NADPH-dependent F420 reductase [Halorhabdus sp. CBA1104]|uniref:NADPH-dependent F420 reductase n=1 Tax=unclassified Halorhabdus TaxID=2621901 RepID=UPI0012B430B9|nr:MULTISPECIES: NADPH-dependent F420 reductase [unclassified Halorhabdus]QGN06481.1 NADPH-dependent F420 reductase [Halorhabdus sp. CBA1104]
MRVAILGGTGDVGEGLALRWAHDTDHQLVIGSRDAERARSAADEYETELADQGLDVTIEGLANEAAVTGADVVVTAVPAYHLVETIEAVRDDLAAGTVLVSPAVGMKRDEAGMHYNRPGAGSVTALAADAAPADVPVVGAFHNLAAGRLADLDAELSIDVLLVGNDDDALGTVASLTEAIDGLRALHAGPIDNAAEVESVTPLLINLAQYNDDHHDVGARFE